VNSCPLCHAAVCFAMQCLVLGIRSHVPPMARLCMMCLGFLYLHSLSPQEQRQREAKERAAKAQSEREKILADRASLPIYAYR
jgi:hypothetical protein